ncbi:hypothetical protein CH251_10280 [Rhodococcus sp. 06-462-5]|uniref:hypothetical protein n=1 Tax=unclassified Rhodococcus (in: high G+C Gram-positive bacteria) TaxID=192944 RepID=UPI000B9BFB26|nr:MULTISPECIES: hypothetical protein [unclassified Rhodococcus (in: high G+C Gram-positive bacteria)]OZC75164.1 hypothetical protein CH251_10280 [Rhodococcus sp. 06-462-5]OZE67681.1 hypothetical protein CH270_07875 [Rhodococcus sp. 02-925g]
MPTTDPFHALVLMNAVFASAAWCLAKPSWPAAISLVASSILWLFLNAPIEGAVLYVVDANRGLTESDFITVAGVILAGVTVARVRRGRRSSAKA